MTGPVFTVRFITPSRVFEREVRYIRLRDDTGYFGLMKGHADFLTILAPALGYYTDSDGDEMFLAVNGGVLRVRDGKITLATREIYEDRDAEKLSESIKSTMLRKEASEAAFQNLLQGLERSFMEKAIQEERSRI